MVTGSPLHREQSLGELKRGRPEVRQLNVHIVLFVVGHHQDIPGFQIPVDHVEAVQEAQRLRHLVHHAVHHDAIDDEIRIVHRRGEASLVGEFEDQAKRAKADTDEIYEEGVFSDVSHHIHLLADFGILFDDASFASAARELLDRHRLIVTESTVDRAE